MAKHNFQGRLQTRSFTGKDGAQKAVTEIIAEDMLMLGGKPQEGAQANAPQAAAASAAEAEAAIDQADQETIDVEPSEIPF